MLIQVEHQEHPQKRNEWEMEVVTFVVGEVVKAESYKHQVLIPLSSSELETLETSNQLNQTTDVSAYVAVPKLS